MSERADVACPGRGEEIFLLAAGALEDEERARLAAHLDTGCVRCRDDLARAEAQLAGLALSLAPVEPSEGVRRRLLARVGEDLRRRPAAAPRRIAARARDWAAAAAIALLVGTAFGAFFVERRVVAPLRAQAGAGAELGESIAELEAEVADLEEMMAEQDAELGDLESRLSLAQEQLRMFRGDSLVRVALRGSGDLAEVHARMYWEWTDEYTCYLHVKALPVPPEGRAQVVWLEDADGGFVRVGVLVREAGGTATLFAKLPQDERRVVRALVSEESGAPGEAPRGSVLLSAEL